MTEFLEAAQVIRSEKTGTDYVRSIKDLVAKELQRIDPTAELEDTQYFNHSAIPDFVVSWSGEKASRHVYLRASYASVVAAHDLRQGNDSSAMFLSLNDQKEFDDEFPRIGPSEIAKEAGRSKSSLLTDARAIDEIAADDSPAERSPIASLVRENFVRGGRGWIDTPRASNLVSASRDREPGTSITGLVRENFDPASAVQLERTAALMDQVLASGSTEAVAPNLSSLEGTLSTSELRNLLPWLLENVSESVTPDFWERFGQMVDFAWLQRAASSIDQRDISALVMPNINRWTARRAYLGLAVEAVDTPTWRFRGGHLCLEIDNSRITFSDDGRSLRGRDSATSPRWDDVRTVLEGFKLASVAMRGVTRSVRIDARESDDIRGDIESVAESLTDSYSVTDIAVTFSDPIEDGEVVVSIDFGKSLALADPYASVGDLSQAAMTLLSYRTPVGGGSPAAAFGDEGR